MLRRRKKVLFEYNDKGKKRFKTFTPIDLQQLLPYLTEQTAITATTLKNQLQK
jgi:hypothetical protein